MTFITNVFISFFLDKMKVQFRYETNLVIHQLLAIIWVTSIIVKITYWSIFPPKRKLRRITSIAIVVREQLPPQPQLWSTMAHFLGMARYAKKCIYKRLSIFFAITLIHLLRGNYNCSLCKFPHTENMLVRFTNVYF